MSRRRWHGTGDRNCRARYRRLDQHLEVLVIGFGRGVMMAFNQPARQSPISGVVPSGELRHAIALNSASMNLTRVIGPSIGAAAIAIAGLQGAFWLNTASFIVLLWSLFAMQFLQRTVELVGSIIEEIGYLHRHETLGTLVPLAIVPMVFGMSYIYILPVFARDILHVGADGNAFLVAASGVGGISAALAIALAQSFRRRGWLLLVGFAAFGTFA